jgi:hypothetical protein
MAQRQLCVVPMAEKVLLQDGGLLGAQEGHAVMPAPALKAPRYPVIVDLCIRSVAGCMTSLAGGQARTA